MAAVNYYKRRKEINGVTYEAQFNGLSTYLKSLDESRTEIGALSNEKMYKVFLKNYITEPANLDPDSFDDMETLDEVCNFAKEVAQGRFREEKNAAATGAKA